LIILENIFGTSWGDYLSLKKPAVSVNLAAVVPLVAGYCAHRLMNQAGLMVPRVKKKKKKKKKKEWMKTRS
jgi:hypothetical protein